MKSDSMEYLTRFFGATCLFCFVSGCISSKGSEYGATPAAKNLSLAACEGGLLDDGEDGNSQIARIRGRDGYWFTFADTFGSKVEPRGEFRMSEGGRPGEPESRFFAKVSGHVASVGDSLYVGMGFALTNPKMAYDLSMAQGIQFWARGPGRIRFKVADINTAPEGDRCSDCYNDFGVDLALSERFERYTIPFSALRQQPGWGDRAPRVASAKVFALQWQFSTPGADFEISVDDLVLVGCDPGK